MTRAFIDTLTFEGFLEKQGKLKTWSWKKYWFVLDGDQLCYYKDSSKTSGQGLIDMAQAQTVRVVEISRGPSLEIVTQSRAHVLCASNKELREKWLKFLRRAMVLRKRCSSLMMRPSCDSISDDEEHLYEAVDKVSPQNGYHDNKVSPKTEEMAGHSEIMHTNSLYVSHDTSSNSPLYAEVSDLEPKKIDWKASTTPSYTAVKKREGDPARHSGGIKGQMSLARLEYRMTYAEPFDNKIVDANSEDPDYDEVFSEEKSERAVKIPRDKDQNCDTSDDELNNNEKVYDEVNRKFNINFPSIPDLPNPRLELTWGSAFDEIRTFIANNRSPNELYAIPRRSERGGKAIKKLKDFLTELDGEENCLGAL